MADGRRRIGLSMRVGLIDTAEFVSFGSAMIVSGGGDGGVGSGRLILSRYVGGRGGVRTASLEPGVVTIHRGMWMVWMVSYVVLPTSAGEIVCSIGWWRERQLMQILATIEGISWEVRWCWNAPWRPFDLDAFDIEQ